ncbi:hypothetical protein MTO96_022501 [Rhipicephalus appendiculatus]
MALRAVLALEPRCVATLSCDVFLSSTFEAAVPLDKSPTNLVGCHGGLAVLYGVVTVAAQYAWLFVADPAASAKADGTGGCKRGLLRSFPVGLDFRRHLERELFSLPSICRNFITSRTSSCRDLGVALLFVSVSFIENRGSRLGCYSLPSR